MAPLPGLLELATPFFGEKTRGLFLKGRDAEAEVAEARTRFDFGCRIHPSLTANDSCIVEVTGLRRKTEASAP